jgi:hypothetical protein
MIFSKVNVLLIKGKGTNEKESNVIDLFSQLRQYRVDLN